MLESLLKTLKPDFQKLTKSLKEVEDRELHVTPTVPPIEEEDVLV